MMARMANIHIARGKTPGFCFVNKHRNEGANVF